MVHSCNYNVIMNLPGVRWGGGGGQGPKPDIDVSTYACLRLSPVLLIFDVLCAGKDPGTGSQMPFLLLLGKDSRQHFQALPPGLLPSVLRAGFFHPLSLLDFASGPVKPKK